MFDAVFLKRKGQDADFQFNNGLGRTFLRFGISMTKKSCFSHMRLFFSICICNDSSRSFSCMFFDVYRINESFTILMQGVLYGSVGFMCGLIGQGIANLIMTAKR